MKRQHPNPGMSIPISVGLFQQLCAAGCRSGFALEDWEITDIAIREWIARNTSSLTEPASRGYQWKQLFLPDGALLRTSFNGMQHHGRVEGGRLLHDGQSISPNQFANVAGGSHRNAWEVVWVMLPDGRSWQRAGEFRMKQRAVQIQTDQAERSDGATAQTSPYSTSQVPRERRNANRPLGN